MKTLTAILFSMLFWATSAHAQAVYAADSYELRNTNPCGSIDGDKIYNADKYGLSKKLVGFIEDGKIYSADIYGVKNVIVGYIDGHTIYNADTYEVKYKPIAIITDGKVYDADVYGVKGKIIGYYTSNENAGAACAAILKLLRRR